VVTVYRKYEENLNKVNQAEQLQNQVEKLQKDLEREKSKNHSMAMLLRQYDTSTRMEFEDTENIY